MSLWIIVIIKIRTKKYRMLFLEETQNRFGLG